MLFGVTVMLPVGVTPRNSNQSNVVSGYPIKADGVSVIRGPAYLWNVKS